MKPTTKPQHQVISSACAFALIIILGQIVLDLPPRAVWMAPIAVFAMQYAMFIYKGKPRKK